ncbi:hypothetical protein [Protofrankia symbiont of Coriaria ruscifolia]|uniref:hypothetical protein n=1 Tax=Protofrankia symbiont of Coriaria ruscifolia TaxID=1306542 RepID=UPI001A93B2CF|nr:hypothetical protein [Protofrankia symbiont of Coriaria ruscifolia]
MRDLLPPEKLASLLASFTPPLDPTDPDWTDLCSALETYDQAEPLGVNLDQARSQVDAAATILHRGASTPTRHERQRRGRARDRAGGVHEHQAV